MRRINEVEYEHEAELERRVNELCGEVTMLKDKFEWMLMKLKEVEEKSAVAMPRRFLWKRK